MDTIFSKLNYKEGQTIYVVNTPETFEAVLATIPTDIHVKKEILATDEVEFVLIFVTSKAELVALSNKICPLLKGDALFWMAYPKGTSKKYKCDFNRDNCWEIMKPSGMLPVRQIAIDNDWSALRFRKATFIKSLTRKERE